jgi:hypothetical protein
MNLPAQFLVLALVCGALRCPAQSSTPPARVPLIYCTDLFHPHDDPDDHFDLATVFAVPEFDLQCVILDQGEVQLKRPGNVAVAQLNHITGRKVPAFRGLGAKLRTPQDTGLDQPAQFQEGVSAILATLRQATNPVAIAAVGSMRDVAAAFNREPALFRAKVGKLMAFIGEASKQDFREWNVGLDPQAYIGLMRSGMRFYWVPCFDGGEMQNAGHASFWQAKQGDLLRDASPQLLQYFIYALEKETADPLRFLTEPVDPTRRAHLFATTRNLWCTTILASLAGRELARDGEHFVSRPPTMGSLADPTLHNDLFAFQAVTVSMTDDAVVKYGPGPDAHRLRRFVVHDRTNYARGMTEATAGLLATLGRTASNAPAATTLAPSVLVSNSVFCISNRVHGKNGADTNRTRMLFTSQKWARSSTNATARNTNCWLHGAKGVTAISSFNAAAVYHSPGTPITPRHIVMAFHNHTLPTNRFEFVTATNQVIARTMIAQTNCATVPDLTIGLLDADLPTSIGFLRVAPPKFRELLPLRLRDAKVSFHDFLGRTRTRDMFVPVVAFNHWKQAFVADFGGFGVFPDQSLWFPKWFGCAGGGDSGHPLCLLVNDELILLCHYTSAMGGALYADHIADINAAMESLSRTHGAPVYRLATADDLLSFNSERSH